MRKRVERKTEPECQSDVRITNEKMVGNNTRRNWLLVHQEVSCLCNIAECGVCVFLFVSLLVLSRLSVNRCVEIVFPLLSGV